MIRVKTAIGLLVLCSSTYSYGADTTPPLPPDIALLEFLGTTAGLETLGINIDQVLANPKTLNTPTTTQTPAPIQPRIPKNETN